MTPCHSLFSVVSRNSFLTLTGSFYRFHIPMPPLCHGDAPVPAPAATVWCVSSFFSFFLYFGFGLQAPHPNPPSSPLPPSYHGDVPSPAAAVWCILKDFFFSFRFGLQVPHPNPPSMPS